MAHGTPDHNSTEGELDRNRRVNFWRSAAETWLNEYRVRSDLGNKLIALSLGVSDHVVEFQEKRWFPRKTLLPELSDEAPEPLVKSLGLMSSFGKGKEVARSFTYEDLIKSVLSEVATAATNDGKLIEECPTGETLEICGPGQQFYDLVARAQKDHLCACMTVTPASEPLGSMTTGNDANNDDEEDPLAGFPGPPDF